MADEGHINVRFENPADDCPDIVMLYNGPHVKIVSQYKAVKAKPAAQKIPCDLGREAGRPLGVKLRIGNVRQHDRGNIAGNGGFKRDEIKLFKAAQVHIADRQIHVGIQDRASDSREMFGDRNNTVLLQMLDNGHPQP